MAKIDFKPSPVADAIFARNVRDNEDWRREHLGASLIGRPCTRYLWYVFRWAVDPAFEGRMLRLFERGQREEAWIIEELRALGWEVWCEDESKPVGADGKHPQFRVEWCGGHVGGGSDGIVRGVVGAPKTPHLLEVKTSNDRLFKELVRDGVEKSKPEHHTQMQIYMKGQKLKRALYVCVNKNTDHIYTERVHYKAKVAAAEIAKATLVVKSAGPLEKISQDPSWYQCKFCDYRPVCHGQEFLSLERNCRTCAESTPEDDGTWTCKHHGIKLDGDAQRKGCEDQRFNPKLLAPWTVAGFDENHRLVHYHTPEGVTVTDNGETLMSITV